MDLQAFIQDEVTRRKAFPVTGQCVFLGHAGVAPLPRAAADLMREFLDRASHHRQEGAWTETWVEASRRFAAELLGAEPGEIALLGPTALGLNLVAAGLPWRPGDEVVYYPTTIPPTCIHGSRSARAA